jgi:hypothetical protein
MGRTPSTPSCKSASPPGLGPCTAEHAHQSVGGLLDATADATVAARSPSPSQPDAAEPNPRPAGGSEHKSSTEITQTQSVWVGPDFERRYGLTFQESSTAWRFCAGHATHSLPRARRPSWPSLTRQSDGHEQALSAGQKRYTTTIRPAAGQIRGGVTRRGLEPTAINLSAFGAPLTLGPRR